MTYFNKTISLPAKAYISICTSFGLYIGTCNIYHGNVINYRDYKYHNYKKLNITLYYILSGFLFTSVSITKGLFYGITSPMSIIIVLKDIKTNGGRKHYYPLTRYFSTYYQRYNV